MFPMLVNVKNSIDINIDKTMVPVYNSYTVKGDLNPKILKAVSFWTFHLREFWAPLKY
jgi:hypothetical protein